MRDRFGQEPEDTPFTVEIRASQIRWPCPFARISITDL
jgi:hypothetical protein